MDGTSLGIDTKSCIAHPMWRRQLFTDQPPIITAGSSVSEGSR
jgi:hypothetical protein